MCPRITYMLFALALTGACRSTPLDLVYAADVIDAAAGATVGGAGAGGAGAGGAGAGGGGGSAAEGGTCSMVGPGTVTTRTSPFPCQQSARIGPSFSSSNDGTQLCNHLDVP